MQTLEALGRQIQSVRDLGSVVKTMKSLAAVNIRQYEQAVAALQNYTRSLELGMQIVVRRRPEFFKTAEPTSPHPVAAIVLGSDQGMCGQFNSRIARHAEQHLEYVDNGARSLWILVVGTRAAAELDSQRYKVSDTLLLPGSVTEITSRVQDILLRINRWREQEQVRRIWIFHQRPLSGASYEPHFEQVFPLSEDWLQSLRSKPWPTRMLPTFTMHWQQLLSSLIRQSLFGSLYRALAESLAAENAARLASMQAAEKNIDQRLDELTTQYHQGRQNAITEELLDVTAGFEVLGHDEPVV